MKRKFNRITWMRLILISALVILLPYKGDVRGESYSITDLQPMEDYPEKGHPKMESALYRMMKVYLTRGMEQAKEFAKQRLIDMDKDHVRVVLETQPTGTSETEIKGATSSVKSEVENLGGMVETSYRQLVQSIVPLDALQNLADMPSVRFIRRPVKFIAFGTSEGVATINADDWHSIPPFHSAGAKICILDAGFDGYEGLLGTDLPSSVTARSFRADNDIHADTVHGTACAEIVYDTAPNAQMYLANFETDSELGNAVDWMIEQGVEIVSFSMGTYYGAGDGTGTICEIVKKAANNGITWVAAAGNEAEDHWQGAWQDTDNDDWHNFTGQDEMLDFYVPAYSVVAAFLKWDDWGSWNGTSYSGSDQDYDLYLWVWTGSYWGLVDWSTSYQAGTQAPYESIGYWYTDFSTKWGISISKYSATKDVKFDFFSMGNSEPVEYNVKAGSLSVPADSPHAIAVGATDWNTDALHSYSSQGPTADGRTKPNYAAPSGVSTVSYDPLAFLGTSAACPHVAGTFALLKGKTPFTLDQIKAVLDSRAVDLGATGEDNEYGIGRIDVGK